MIKKVLIALSAVLVLLVSTGLIFKDQLTSFAYARITQDMFVEEDNDDFEPGVTAVDAFPPIKVSRNGNVFTELSSFTGPRGLVVIFSRSVVW